MDKRGYRALFSNLAAVLLTACVHTAAPTALRIDGSTPTTFQSSWDQLYKSLSPSQRSQLEVAILPIALGKYHSFVDVPPSTLAGIGPQTIRSEIDGMSFREILDLAQKQPIKIGLPQHP